MCQRGRPRGPAKPPGSPIKRNAARVRFYTEVLRSLGLQCTRHAVDMCTYLVTVYGCFTACASLCISVGPCQMAFVRLNRFTAVLQSTRRIAPSRDDENMGTFYDNQYHRFRQIKRRRVEPVTVPIVHLDLPVYRPGQLCRCTGCKRKSLDLVAEEESEAAAEAERAWEDPKAKKVWSLKDFSNVILPTSFLQEVATGVMCVHSSTLQRC